MHSFFFLLLESLVWEIKLVILCLHIICYLLSTYHGTQLQGKMNSYSKFQFTIYEIVVTGKEYWGYSVSHHLLPSKSTELASQFSWISEGFPWLLWYIRQQNLICSRWMSRIFMTGFALLNKELLCLSLTLGIGYWISKISCFPGTYLCLYRTGGIAFSCNSEILFTEWAQAYLILLCFPISLFTGHFHQGKTLHQQKDYD